MHEQRDQQQDQQQIREQDLQLRELYQQVIIDHGRHPRNFRVVEGYSHYAEGYNPVCGDRLQLYLRLGPGPDPVIEDVAFVGQGCAISMASASMLTESLKGKTEVAARDLFQRFHALVTDAGESPAALGKLRVLAGVKAFPSRIKCATLAWHTLVSALDQPGDGDSQGSENKGSDSQGSENQGSQARVSTE